MPIKESWKPGLRGALSHLNAKVRPYFPMSSLGSIPLDILIGSEPLGDLLTLPDSPAVWELDLFGEEACAHPLLPGKQKGLSNCMLGWLVRGGWHCIGNPSFLVVIIISRWVQWTGSAPSLPPTRMEE